MRMYVGVTDWDWYDRLSRKSLEEVNFWSPGGVNFKALQPGELFLFKLHSPRNYIVGGGFFFKFWKLPASLAWEAFGEANGTTDLLSLERRIHKYKGTDRFSDPDPEIGCRILSFPFFFSRDRWIEVPKNWSSNIVSGKTYDTGEPHGAALYGQVMERLHTVDSGELIFADSSPDNRYGPEVLIRPRAGQGSFKILIANAYKRRCAITAEKTLPVLEAAHIRPYSLEGPHAVSNGLFLRRDFHTLFDRGYITINRDLEVEVSHRIKEDFGNGREYYAHHGSKLRILPEHKNDSPDPDYLDWHNSNIYLG